jgi:hypothetical protein
MSTAIDHIRPAGRRSVLAEAATPVATPPATAAVPGRQDLGGGLVLLGGTAAVARLAGAVLLVLGAAVAGTIMMGARAIAAVLRIALLTWAIGGSDRIVGPAGRGPWPPRPRRR